MGLDSRWRAAAWAVCLALASAAMVVLARTGDFTVPTIVLMGSDTALALALFAGPGALDVRHLPARMRDVVRPGLWNVVAQTAAGCLAFPLTLDGGEPDYSWFGVVPLLTILVGAGAGLLAILLFVLVLAPATVLVLRAPAAVRGDPQARQAILYGAVPLAIVTMGTALAAGDSSHDQPSGVRLVGLLTGLTEAAPGRGPLIWVARAALLLVIACVVLLVRVRRAITAAGGDPDAGLPAQDLRP